ncbi:hypothetical protein C3Y91_14970 [Rhizobium sp. UPM1133]|nr:hypothetical protein [Rhizobium ruizarguesonis]
MFHFFEKTSPTRSRSTATLAEDQLRRPHRRGTLPHQAGLTCAETQGDVTLFHHRPDKALV